MVHKPTFQCVMREQKIATSFHCLVQICIQNSATKSQIPLPSESQPKPSVCCSKAVVVSYLETPPNPFTSSLCPWRPSHHEVCFPPVYGNKRNGVCVKTNQMAAHPFGIFLPLSQCSPQY
ncbi:hypothetical protein CGRA01v4_00375 [Colletotrichum graminicola]|nr:hypothetical protein CGRA01v4_00375 [Colletotrichum graminicola]